MSVIPPVLRLPQPLLDALVEPVLVLDATGVIQFANQAALRLLTCEPGSVLRELVPVLGGEVVSWLQSCLRGRDQPAPVAAPGRVLPLLSPIDRSLWALMLPTGALQPPPQRVVAPPPPQVNPVDDRALRELHSMLWGAPFPALLQDESFRIIDANQAFADLGGWSRQGLAGLDLMALQPESEHAATLADRRRLLADPQQADVPVLMEQRLVDARGQVHWVRAARYLTLTSDRRRLLLTLMQETTAEHAAREQAERYSRELDQWFDLSPLGMVLFDEAGLVLRSNHAFEHLIGQAVVDLRETSPEVRTLLQWPVPDGDERGAPDGAAHGWFSSEGPLQQADGSNRWVRALCRRIEVRGAQRRCMCMLEDRTAEEERDLAQLQLGALVDTAGVGLATYRGMALSGRTALSNGQQAPLQGVRRELVLASSLPEFERLQRALKQGDRCEVRYAIQHPELGQRWLVTRVEPGQLASGRPTTSVVTLDITEQQSAQERAEQVLAELSTILESSPAGIASMRGYTLMHCNRRFERMLRLPAGAAVGSDIRALLATQATGMNAPDALNDTLDQGVLYEAELEVRGDDGQQHWYALSIRRTAPGGSAPQSIALLSEITRLKVQQAQLEALAREREQMAQVLGQQADRNRAVLDSVLVGIVTVNQQGDITWLNRSARRMFGGDLGDFLGQPLVAVANGDQTHPFQHCLDLFEELRDGEAVKFECRLQARDSRTFWVVGNAVATVGASGARELTYALMDIEQRRQAEARIAEARASLQRIIEVAPMAITLYDAQSLAVLQLNRVAAALSGVGADQAIGRLPEQLYSADQAQRVRADLQAVLSGTEAVTQREYSFESPELGGVQVWDARYLPLSRVAGQVSQILMVASDVTAQRAAQRAELQAAIAQREMLVQEVHHRIKNNLQGVAGLMQQVAARRPEVQPIIAEVVGQVQAIAQVYGLQVGAMGPLRVRNVVEAIAQSVQRTFGRGIEFEVEGPSPQQWALPEAESIPIALTLNELLTNAIKHSDAGTTIGCRLVTEEGGVRVEISNQGQLSPGFRIDHRPAAVSGLGLVRALLPRRHASLGIEQLGSRVIATVTLSMPVVIRLLHNAAAAPGAA
ncbi:hypothetical protein C7444_11882 [Sphaerotilus hippei]|uniref:PAS domain S-box-containing protein n=1 Tax=Sphaerotilus hippei TaxID=744406 RepID=A0A318H093_9BURK|nr:PAS domain S-box protein [Sphaerotilus hippei]PXW93713.1 hypothetical protein C7444_11882 [Sphaerotilus hippei]